MPQQIAGLDVPDDELEIVFVRGSGPGGQNVNKVSSAAQLRFALGRSQVFNARVAARLRALAGHRLTDAGDILILARTHRTQEGNRREALERLADLFERALVEPKTRHKTRPTRASKTRRLDSKTRRATHKKLRGRVGHDD